MSEELPRSVYQGEVKIGNMILKCHVLSDGQRVIEADSFEKFRLAMESGDLNLSQDDCVDFSNFMHKGELK